MSSRRKKPSLQNAKLKLKKLKEKVPSCKELLTYLNTKKTDIKRPMVLLMDKEWPLKLILKELRWMS